MSIKLVEMPTGLGWSKVGREDEEIRYVTISQEEDVIYNILLCYYEDKLHPIKKPDSSRKRDGIHWLRVSFLFSQTPPSYWVCQEKGQ